MGWTDPRTWTDGELVTAAIMNPHIRDNLNAVPHLIKRKASDESVTNNTLQDDNDLFFNVGISEVWAVRLVLIVVDASANVAQLKAAFTFPSGGTLSLGTNDFSGAGSATRFFWDTSGSAQGPIGALATTARIIKIEGAYVNGGTAGNLQFQWAQNTTNASAVTIKTNSVMWGDKLA